MDSTEANVISAIVNIDKYPLLDKGSHIRGETINHIRAQLQNEGCAVLSDFINTETKKALHSECASIASLAYNHVEIVNAYNIEVDDDLPQEHPARIQFERGNAFVAKDQIPNSHIIRMLYENRFFKRFVSDCFEKLDLYELADPLSSLCLNVLHSRREHPWHFDTNEFTVSLLTQAPEAGGEFEYCPNIRSRTDENFSNVREVLLGRGENLIKQISLRPGDLQFFKGRFSLHRVAPVIGQQQRHTVIFAYTDRPGVIGNIERTRQLFGRVLPEHYAAQEKTIRNDNLLD